MGIRRIKICFSCLQYVPNSRNTGKCIGSDNTKPVMWNHKCPDDYTVNERIYKVRIPISKQTTIKESTIKPTIKDKPLVVEAEFVLDEEAKEEGLTFP